MSSVLQVFRFVIGLGLVIAGCFLAAPFVSSIVESAQQRQDQRRNNSPVGKNSREQRNQSAGVFTVPGMVAGNPGETGIGSGENCLRQHSPSLIPFVAKPAGKSNMEPSIQLSPMPQTPQVTYHPGLSASYRSTVEVPPPPLLDARMASPVRLPETGGRFAGEPVRPVPDSVPSQYRIRDGDDLTSIANRLYGHPRGAAALWQANADRLSNPEVLPIGMSLTVPPTWEVFAANRGATGRGQQIEPAATVVPVSALVSEERPETAESKAQLSSGLAPWLGYPPTLQPVAPPVSNPPSRGSLRVTSGESLKSIAQRVYGDGSMATTIFAANRDRLRSPDLLIPGMELRLP